MADGDDPFRRNGAPVLSEEEAGRLAAWIRAAADQLGLRDWRFEVSRHPCERESIASSFVQDRSDELWVAVEPEFFQADERRRRQTLTHELLHAHFYRVTRIAEKLIERELGNRTEAVIMAAIHEVEEQTIDRLAWAVSAFLPESPGP